MNYSEFTTNPPPAKECVQPEAPQQLRDRRAKSGVAAGAETGCATTATGPRRPRRPETLERAAAVRRRQRRRRWDSGRDSGSLVCVYVPPPAPPLRTGASGGHSRDSLYSGPETESALTAAAFL